MWTIKQQCTSLQMPCSTKSYGAAARFSNESNLNIVMVKTRAVPLKLLTLPLLELMAADWELSCKIHSKKLILSTGLTAKSILQTVEKVRSKLTTSISNPQITLCIHIEILAHTWNLCNTHKNIQYKWKYHSTIKNNTRGPCATSLT